MSGFGSVLKVLLDCDLGSLVCLLFSVSTVSVVTHV